eukprot:TRINITY_DN23067_c0_g1_i3.p1 TRINITY_DN23067_c0_g1~~TRINITY_DN23067_c0_g1_i3.p1  ORF type:complete len:309 (+),score=85.48 TRINITY_DN23067_c0_g1_i3:71-928(+)
MALQLWIRSGTQEQRAVELAANATVQDLMSAAREALGLASSGLRLSCGGVELRDPALPIADAGVAAEAVIDAQVGSVFQWDPVSLQHGYEFLYTVSEGGTEAQKTKRPEIITIIRTTRPAESGETFRVRVLQEGPQDECNGIGFGVGTTVHTTSPWHQVGAKPTTWDSCALNGAGSVCVQDSGGMIVDGADHPERRGRGGRGGRGGSAARPLPKLEAGCTVTGRYELSPDASTRCRVWFSLQLPDGSEHSWSGGWDCGGPLLYSADPDIYPACCFRGEGWRVRLE